MRISDWSSDVCSSDLGGERGRAGPAVALPMKPYPLRVADRGRLALAPESAHLGPIVQMGVGDDRARGLDELPMPEHIGQRSEEHTSELQSLMRISYAVFCLKKTNNNNLKTTTTHYTSIIHT